MLPLLTHIIEANHASGRLLSLCHLAFIGVESFFRAAELIGLRLAVSIGVWLLRGTGVVLLLRPPGFLCCPDSGTCCSTHVAGVSHPSPWVETARKLPSKAPIAGQPERAEHGVS